MPASVRHGFRWDKDEFSEPTSTLALDIGGWYIDLRYFLKDEKIEWAMAGKRETLQQEPLKIRWTRYVDSFGEPGAKDDGDFKKLPNGDDLESGKMVSPDHNNELTYYEELWREGPLVDAKPGSWIAESVGGETRSRTWIGRMGGYYLAMRELDSKTGEFAALREDWVGGKWAVKFAAGANANLPSVQAVETGGFEEIKEGSEFTVDGVTYLLRATQR